MSEYFSKEDIEQSIERVLGRWEDKLNYRMECLVSEIQQDISLLPTISITPDIYISKREEEKSS